MHRAALFALLAGAVAACGLDLAGTGPVLLDGGDANDATTGKVDAKADAPHDGGATDGANTPDAPFVPPSDAAPDGGADTSAPPPFTCGATKVHDCYSECAAAPIACGSSTCVASCDQCGSSKYTCSVCASAIGPRTAETCTDLNPLNCNGSCHCLGSADCPNATDVCILSFCIPCGQLGTIGTPATQCQNGKTCQAGDGGFVCR